jgi:hypothetical protein
MLDSIPNATFCGWVCRQAQNAGENQPAGCIFVLSLTAYFASISHYPTKHKLHG